MTTPIAPETPSVDTFGGTFRDGDGVVDPETELAAAHFNNLTAQVAAMGHTAPRAWARCAVVAAVAELSDADAVWGNGEAVAPTVARTSAGVYTVTWAASYNDLRASPEAHAVSLRACHESVYAAAGARISDSRVSAANVVTVRTFDAAGAPADVDQFSVWVY